MVCWLAVFSKVQENIDKSWEELERNINHTDRGILPRVFCLVFSDASEDLVNINCQESFFLSCGKKATFFFPVCNLSLFRIKSRLTGQSFITAMLK